MPSKSTEALFLFPRHLLALLARLGECDGDRLLAAFHLAAFSTLAALRFSPLVAVHLALHFGAGAARIFSFPLLGHTSLRKIDAVKTKGRTRRKTYYQT